MSEKEGPQVEIYTDGACKGNPGVGGWGALLISGAHRKELCGAEPMTTNNRMELMAVIVALQSLKQPSRVEVHADSQYVVKGMTEWLSGWKRRGWRTSDGSPVKNVDLWQQLDTAASGHRIGWNWVRGHAGHPGNERADALANEGIVALTGKREGR
ncbi:MAG: ribonuclease HI [Betaproteobacteria bacterium]|nr:ribonuclease HI [Betaproteobacteria bacterium]